MRQTWVSTGNSCLHAAQEALQTGILGAQQVQTITSAEPTGTISNTSSWLQSTLLAKQPLSNLRRDQRQHAGCTLAYAGRSP